MPRISFLHTLPRTAAALFSAIVCMVTLCALTTASAQAQITLLVPSQPSIEAPAKSEKADPAGKRDDKKQEARQAAPKTEKNADAGKKSAPAKAAPQAAAPAQGQTAPPNADQNTAQNTAATAGQAPAQTAEETPAPPPGPELPAIDEQVDVLITMMRPFQNQGLVMDMPQLFAVLRYDNASPVKDGLIQPERRDLLGDVEEIGYLDQKAWGANVALAHPGLYQFIIEGRPWWDAAHGQFLQHYVKAVLPVYGVERGWDQAVGQTFEIQPLVRPFGLTAPALFSGVVLLHGKPLANASVRMSRINTEKRTVPTPWHEEMAARSDKAGQFSFILNQPGWWYCVAITPGDPLKGPDGQPKALNLGAVFWLYVDGAADARKR